MCSPEQGHAEGSGGLQAGSDRAGRHAARDDGFELCRQIRQSAVLARTPVLFLTARSDEVDRVLGLEIGGDDYMTKPFSPRELVARVKAHLRARARSMPKPPPSRSARSGWTAARRRVFLRGART